MRVNYNGRFIPEEYIDIINRYDKTRDLIYKIKKDEEYNKPTFRFTNRFKKFLEKEYKGNLPKTLEELAKYFGYGDDIASLFKFDTDTQYKNMYPDTYRRFYENLSDWDKRSLFFRADYGRRNVFEFKQDVIASNIFENMISEYSHNCLRPNPESSGRNNNNNISTKCDFIFYIKDKYNIPVELKSKWYFPEGGIELDFRGSAKTIIEEKGIALQIFPSLNKCAIKDMTKKIELEKGTMAGDKEGDKMTIKKEDLFDFKFWVDDDMKMLLKRIRETIDERG